MNAVVQRIQEFVKLESFAGLVLMGSALLALVVSNSPLSGLYDAFLSTRFSIELGELALSKPLLLWINDGLMAVFFFLVGLEIKRELIEGELNSADKATLPVIAAIGGIAIPASIYFAVNWNSPSTIDGWAIPAATDIAFALGVLMLLGNRVPAALKVMLLAIAIIDDLGAILIIALFYTGNLSLTMLGIAVAGLLALVALNVSGVRKIAPYILIGVLVWVCVLKSGIHATLAGVAIALLIPITSGKGDEEVEELSPLKKLEHDLHPWVAYLVLPLFAFANAGVSFEGLTVDDMLTTVTIGIALGLLVGKPLGIMGASFIAVKSGLARLPEGLGWRHVGGVSVLAGIGFTMSLFIGTLAFDDGGLLNEVRIGVLGGSVISALLGFFLLRSLTKAPAGGA